MNRIAPLCCIALGLFAMTSGFAQSSAQKTSLLVVNQGDASLSFIDTDTNQQIAVLKEDVPKMVGHEVATSPDGRIAYLPLYGDNAVGKPGYDGHLMLVIDIASHKVMKTFDFGHGVRPHCVLYEPQSNLLYVTTELDQTITLIDPKTLTIVGKVPTGQAESHMLAISRDGKLGYTANVGPGTVSVLDLVNRRLVKVIPIAPVTQRIAISNDDKMVFTSDQTKPRMAVIDTGTNNIAHWIDLSAPGYGSAPTKDGKMLLVTMPTADALEVVDLGTLKAVRTIQIGPKPQEVLVRPDGKVAYVSCFNSHQVAVLDLATWKVTGMIDAGQKADGIAWAGH